MIGAIAFCVSCAGQPGAREPEEAAAQGAESTVPPQTVEEQPPRVEPEAQEFVVTEEVYIKTFDEIRDFIQNLNQIIRSEDYETWLTYLSDDYIQITSDPVYLKDQSEKPLLKQSNIELRDLKDYFYHVVVPSRSQAQLDEIEFLDEDHVKAISILRSTRVVLYLLVRAGGRWKIGVW